MANDSYYQLNDDNKTWYKIEYFPIMQSEMISW